MTRKDFVLIAETIREAELDNETRQQLAGHFARALRQTNPRFDVERFVEAATGLTRALRV